MSNVIPLRKTRRVLTTVHQVTFDLVPREVVESVFYTALAVGWGAEDGDVAGSTPEACARIESLITAISAAAQYTVPIEREVDEPIV
jgi:hypothetical protein